MKKLTIFALGGILLLTGCSTVVNSHYQKGSMVSSYISGDGEGAASEVLSKLDEPAWYNTSRINTGDELAWRLEACSIFFSIGAYEEALKHMEAAENLIAEYDERATISARDAGSEVASALTNPNAIPYKGWCRDRMGLEIYKSLTYLALGREDSFMAQVRRLRDAQKIIQEDFAKVFEKEKTEMSSAMEERKMDNSQYTEEAVFNRFPSMAKSYAEMRKIANKSYGAFLNPLALYLSALGNLRDGNWSSAAIDTERMHQAMPSNPFVSRLHATVCKKAGRSLPADLSGVEPFNFPIDQDCLYVIMANGRGAAFESQGIHVIMEVSWPRFTEYPAPYHKMDVTVDNVKTSTVPVFTEYPAPYHKMDVTVDNVKTSTVPVADMDSILAQEFNERLPGIITRIAVSTAIKETAFHGAWITATASNNNNVKIIAGSIAIFMMLYRYIMNTADTRSWELLPKEFQIAQVPMPKDRKIRFNLTTTDGDDTEEAELEIPENARSGILFVNAPSYRNITSAFFPFKNK